MKKNKKQILFPILPLGILSFILDCILNYITGGNESSIEYTEATAAIGGVIISAVGAGVSMFQSKKNREAAQEFSQAQLEEQKQQLEENIRQTETQMGRLKEQYLKVLGALEFAAIQKQEAEGSTDSTISEDVTS